jgi:hypothetical protein
VPEKLPGKPVAKPAPVAPTPDTDTPAPASDSEVKKPYLQVITGTTRNGDFIAGLGRSKELVGAMFGELAADALAPKVYEVSESDGYVIIQLTDRSEADMEQFKEESASLQATLAEAKGYERMQSWLLNTCLRLKSEGAIKPNYSLLIAGSDNKQIPYEPCSSLSQTP